MQDAFIAEYDKMAVVLEPRLFRYYFQRALTVAETVRFISLKNDKSKPKGNGEFALSARLNNAINLKNKDMTISLMSMSRWNNDGKLDNFRKSSRGNRFHIGDELSAYINKKTLHTVMFLTMG